jgi:hypothetical protein
MNHLLIADLARADIADRMRAAEHERLAHRAGAAHRPAGRIRRAATGLRVTFSDWRARTQMGTVSVPMRTDTCPECVGK